MEIRNAKKIVLLLFCCICICSCRSPVKRQEAPSVSAPEVTGNFSVSILDIGKADAIILHSENHTVLIDCGEKGDGQDVLDYLSKSGITNIDYLFITHFDKDHVGGAAKVINNIPIGEIVTPNYAGTSSGYGTYLEAVKENALTPVNLTEKMTFTLDDVLFEVFPPQKSYYEEEDNDFSLIISVTHGENRFLFTGDAEEERLRELYDGQINLEHDFLKVPHHGDSDDLTKTFLNSVNPRYAVITCSEKNPPDKEVTGILSGLGCEVYLTVNGNVEAVSDGKTLTVSQ